MAMHGVPGPRVATNWTRGGVPNIHLAAPNEKRATHSDTQGMERLRCAWT